MIARLVESRQGRWVIFFTLLGLVVGGRMLVRSKTAQELVKQTEDDKPEPQQPIDPQTLQQQNDEMMAVVAGVHTLRSLGKPAVLTVMLLPHWDDNKGMKMERCDLPVAPAEPFVQEVAIGDSSVPTDEEWDTLSNLAPVVPIDSQLTARRVARPRHLRTRDAGTHSA